MRTQPTAPSGAWPPDLVPRGGTLVLAGYGLDVRVSRGRLRVEDGVGRHRREAIVHRATGRLRRLVVLGHTGSITLDAIRWLADLDAGYLQIDEDGRVLAAFGPMGADRAALRRAQARALGTPLGDDIARRLIAEKVAQQAENLGLVAGLPSVTDATVDALGDATARLHVATSRDDVRLAEAMAAAAYWAGISAAPVRFARRDADRVPAHWLTLGTRTSPLTGSPRSAANPANAVLNYLYALLEAEASLAARLVGLDPGLGVLHADQPSRDSLADDLMEPVRPLVDRWALTHLADRSFAASDLYETRQGVCRLTPPVAEELTETLPLWRKAVGRVAEDVARLLDRDTAGRSIPTPLTGRNRAAGRPGGPKTRAASGVTLRACRWCGAEVEPGRETCSHACLTASQSANAEALGRAGPGHLARWRATGNRAELTGDGRRRIGEAAASNVADARAWQRKHPWPSEMGAFAREILPGLEGVSAGVIARATGLSIGYCRQVKAGRATPHPMWWEAIRGLNGV